MFRSGNGPIGLDPIGTGSNWDRVQLGPGPIGPVQLGRVQLGRSNWTGSNWAGDCKGTGTDKCWRAGKFFHTPPDRTVCHFFNGGVRLTAATSSSLFWATGCKLLGVVPGVDFPLLGSNSPCSWGILRTWDTFCRRRKRVMLVGACWVRLRHTVSSLCGALGRTSSALALGCLIDRFILSRRVILSRSRLWD